MKKLILSGVTAFAATAPAYAQNPTNVVELPEFVVTATRTTTPVAATAASVSIITRADIESAGFTTVADALATVPGLIIVRNGTPGQATSVFSRGTESNHTLLTLDGRRVPAMLAGGADWGQLTLDNIERIEVVQSSSSAVHGGDAIGGVVNIVTRSGRGLEKPEYEASFEGGSFNTFHERIAARGAAGGFDYAVALSQFNADYPRDNNNYRRSVTRSSFGYEASENLYLDLKVSYYQTDGGSPGALPGNTTDHLKREVFNISPALSLDVSERWSTRLVYSFENQWQPSFDGGPAFGTRNRLNVAAHVIDWHNTYEITDDWTLSAGVLWQDQAVDRTTTSLFGGAINANLQNQAGYLQSQYSPVEGLSLVNSVRYDAYSDYDNAITWRQAVAYQHQPSASLIRFSVSRSVAPPTAQDLYFFGNPALNPERALSLELGLEKKFLAGRLTTAATLFRHDYKNFIQFNPAAPPFGATVNVPDALAEGVEFSLNWKAHAKLDLACSYTYLTTRDELNDQPLARRPRHHVTAQATVRPSEKLSLSANLGWQADRHDIGAFPAVRDYEDYVLINATAQYQIHKNARVWLRSENLTDASYQYAIGFPALRFGVYGGIGVQF
jgi:vitamin B12 transporter